MSNPLVKPQFVQKGLGEIGRIPSGAYQGTIYPRAVDFIRSAQRSYQIFQYSGAPNTVINPTNGKFYTIFYSPETYDVAASRTAVVQFLSWGGETATATQYLRWYQAYDDDETYDNLHTYVPETTIPADEPGMKTTGRLFSRSVSYPTTSTDHLSADFHCCALGYANMRPAAVSIFRQPSVVGHDDDLIYPTKFSRSGSIIRADNSVEMPEFGELINYAATCPYSAKDTIEAATRRCLFQWGHPQGLWSNENTYRHVMGGFPWPVYPRNTERLSSSIGHEIVLIPAIVVQGESGGWVKYTIPETGDTWLYEIGETLTEPTLVTGAPQTDRCIMSEADPDLLRYCTIELKAAIGGSIILHTVSLWEWLPYPFVAESPS